MIEISWKREADSEEQSYSTQRSLMTIGRDSVNDIVLDNGRVSLYHAAIIQNETGDYFIRDLGSLQGVVVNGQPHHRVLLNRGDTIGIVDYRLKIKHISKGSSASQVFLCGIVTSGEVEIPIIDSNEKYTARGSSSSKTDKTMIDITSSTSVNKDIPTTLSELLKIQELKFLISHLLNEACRQIFNARWGYVALFDIHKRLLLSHRIGMSDDNIPPITRNIYSTITEEGRPSFVEIQANGRVAVLPLKDSNKVIGLMFISDIPEQAFTEEKKQLITSLFENKKLRRHITECYSVPCVQDSTVDKGWFRWKEKFVGHRKTACMLPIYEKIDQIRRSDMHVILLGEKGTGKTYLAHMIHRMSSRGEKGNFVVADLNAIPASLVESELFGTVKGAFSNAVDRAGYFEFANGGTIFLDEIGDLSLDVQSKIRSVIDTKIIRRIGSVEEKKLNMRIIAATNKDLGALIEEGKFRGDLFDRLGGQFSTMNLVPLKERECDIPLLANFFIDELDESRQIEGISRSAIKQLINYDWPGNIRSLRDVIKFAAEMASSENRTVISASDLPDYITKNSAREVQDASPVRFLSLEEIEKEHIMKAMKEANWNKTRACELLGISRPTLNEKLKKYGVDKSTE